MLPPLAHLHPLALASEVFPSLRSGVTEVGEESHLSKPLFPFILLSNWKPKPYFEYIDWDQESESEGNIMNRSQGSLGLNTNTDCFQTACAAAA